MTWLDLHLFTRHATQASSCVKCCPFFCFQVPMLFRLHFLLHCIWFLYNQYLFSLLHFILCRMCVCHTFNKVLTYFHFPPAAAEARRSAFLSPYLFFQVSSYSVAWGVHCLSLLSFRTGSWEKKCRYGICSSWAPAGMGKKGHLPPPLWKCKVFCALVVTAKRSVGELFLYYFHNLSSASGGLTPTVNPSLDPTVDFRADP